MAFHSLRRQLLQKYIVFPKLTGKYSRKNFLISDSSNFLQNRLVPNLKLWKTDRRFYSSYYLEENLSNDKIKDRVMKVCLCYKKIDPCQLRLNSCFITDLGLDSFDHIEVIMKMEDEFCFEIPVVDSDKLMTPFDIVMYVKNKCKERVHKI